MLLPLLQGLSERQARLFLMLAAAASEHPPEALQKLVDEDIAAGRRRAGVNARNRGRKGSCTSTSPHRSSPRG